jgi:hypothetical protein
MRALDRPGAHLVGFLASPPPQCGHLGHTDRPRLTRVPTAGGVWCDSRQRRTGRAVLNCGEIWVSDDTITHGRSEQIIRAATLLTAKMVHPR